MASALVVRVYVVGEAAGIGVCRSYVLRAVLRADLSERAAAYPAAAATGTMGSKRAYVGHAA